MQRMNNDLISREDLKKSMRKSINERYISWTKTITVADIATLIFDEIEYAPTVDTTFKEVVAYECGQKSVERPQGEWIKHYDSSDGFTWLTCSRCMFKAYEDDYNFCPNCGAEMGKEKK